MVLLAMLLGASGQPYWNNLEVYRLNKVQPHDRIIPDGDRWRLCLNGTWRFAFFDNPARATLSPARWDSIRVPGNMELQGFGVPVYVNMRNEFPSNPPYAPTDYNPTGVYARTITLPAAWRGRRDEGQCRRLSSLLPRSVRLLRLCLLPVGHLGLLRARKARLFRCRIL